MSTAIVVLTRSRGGEFTYLEQLAEQLDAPVTIVVDMSGRSDDEERAELEALASRVKNALQHRFIPFRRPDGALPGNKLAYWRCLELGASFGGDALILEDDIELCRNALRRMRLLEVPADLGFLTFFSPATFQGKRQFPGLWRTPTPLMGSQAVKYSAAALEALLSWSSDPEFIKHSASDEAIDLAANRTNLRHAAHCPELVQHVGAVSEHSPGHTLNGWYRVANTYPGRNFDALSLYARDELYR